MKTFKARAMLLLMSIALPLTAFAATEGDYDGDGRADFVVSEVNRSSRVTTFFIFTMSGQRLTRHVRAQGDALVPGDFNGDGVTQPAVVFVRPSGELAWHTLEANGSESVQLFGLNGDTPLVGDFDCDGIDDRAVARRVGSATRWIINFSSGGTGELNHGLNTDTPWVGDVDGDGCDEMVLSRKKNGAMYWYPRKFGPNPATEIQWGAENDTPMRPFDINGDGKDDLLVVRKVGTVDYVFALYNSTQYQAFNLGRSGNVIVIGDFNGNGFGDLLRFVPASSATALSQFYLNPAAARPGIVRFGRSNHSLVRPDGTVVQPGEGVTRGDGGSSGGGSSGGGSVAGCNSRPAWTGGKLWKPVSESKGRPVVLLTRSYLRGARAIQVLGNDGRVVATGSNRGYLANNNRSHFDISKRASEMTKFMPLTMRVTLTNNQTECYSVPDPRKRYN